MAFLPFSERAKRWEPVALELRGMAGAEREVLLDPWKLAEKVGLRVFEDIAGLVGLPDDDKIHLLKSARYDWSAGIYPTPLPDGTFLCILNPSHTRERQKISLMEEIAHRHFGHEPSRITLSGDGLCIRDFSREDEAEAYGVGAAALLPWVTFFPVLNVGRTIEELTEIYDVTTELIEYRIKITGAFRLYQARQRVQRTTGAARL